MKILQKRPAGWFLDNQLIWNARGIETLDDALLLNTPPPQFSNELNVSVVLEDYSEVEDSLFYCYAGFIRFWENWKRYDNHVWLSVDSDIGLAGKVTEGRHNFLGKWIYPHWEELSSNMGRMFARTWVIRKEWYEEFMKKYRGTGKVVCEMDVCWNGNGG